MRENHRARDEKNVYKINKVMVKVKNYYWVARDMNGDINLFEAEPLRLGEFFVARWSFDEVWKLSKELYKGVTWENSPKMVAISVRSRIINK